MFARDIARVVVPSVFSSHAFCEESKFSLPSGDKIVRFVDSSQKRKWIIKFDYRSRNPKWAYEIIEPEECVDISSAKVKPYEIILASLV